MSTYDEKFELRQKISSSDPSRIESPPVKTSILPFKNAYFEKPSNSIIHNRHNIHMISALRILSVGSKKLVR